jgi:hypothetical protein
MAEDNRGSELGNGIHPAGTVGLPVRTWVDVAPSTPRLATTGLPLFSDRIRRYNGSAVVAGAPATTTRCPRYPD